MILSAARFAHRGPLRVFRFRDNAWQCLKDVDICVVYAPGPDGLLLPGDGVDVAIVGHEGTEAAEHFVADPPEATHISTWAEWFDLTLTNAAHAYLLAALSACREWADATAEGTVTTQSEKDAAWRAVCFAERCVQMLVDCFARKSLEVLIRAARNDAVEPPDVSVYFTRVKADIEARLRGEQGRVAEPRPHDEDPNPSKAAP